MTLPVPTPQRDIVITSVYAEQRAIHIQSTPEIRQQITEAGLGVVSNLFQGYCLHASALYDFDDVLAFVRSFGDGDTPVADKD